MELTREIIIDEHTVLIDEEDYERLSKHKWYVSKRRGYKNKWYFINSVYENGKNKNTTLHRMVMNCITNDGKIVDHINGNTLDNRKCNLRICTSAENTRNQSLSKRNKTGYKGVAYRKRSNKYFTRIRVDNKEISIGYYDSAIEAAKAYDRVALKAHGDFALTNFEREAYTEKEINEAYENAISKLYANNTSGYIGVSFHKESNKWATEIKVKKTRYYAGSFDTAKEAAIARDKKAYELLGLKAKLNFPIESAINEYKELEAER